MKLVYKVYTYYNSLDQLRYAYDILDLDDTVVFQGKELNELVAESPRSWSTSQSAEKNAEKHVEELKKNDVKAIHYKFR